MERIRSKFSSSDSPDPHLFPITPPYLSNFNPATFTEIHNHIFSSENTQCELHTDHTYVLVFWNSASTNLALINIIIIINLSLSEGSFPSSFKQTIVHPLLSKNLFFLMMISTTFVLFLIWTVYPKLSRKLLLLVSSLAYYLTLTPYLRHSNLHIACHIPLKPHLILSIHNDLILAMERGVVTYLIILDISAVGQSILFHRLWN